MWVWLFDLSVSNFLVFMTAKLKLLISKIWVLQISAFDSITSDPRFDSRSGHILSFLLPLIQEGQLSVTGESMCTKYWLTI